MVVAPAWVEQSSRTAVWSTPMVPFSDLMPEVMAVAVGAESATWLSWV
jgi:hypothetical protein